MMIDELKALTFFPAGRHIVILSRPICEDFQRPNVQLPAESSAAPHKLVDVSIARPEDGSSSAGLTLTSA